MSPSKMQLASVLIVSLFHFILGVNGFENFAAGVPPFRNTSTPQSQMVSSHSSSTTIVSASRSTSVSTTQSTSTRATVDPRPRFTTSTTATTALNSTRTSSRTKIPNLTGSSHSHQTTSTSSQENTTTSSNDSAGQTIAQITEAPNFDIGALNPADASVYFSKGLGSINFSAFLSGASINISHSHVNNCSMTTYEVNAATATEPASHSVVIETVVVTISATRDTYCDTVILQPSDLSSVFEYLTLACVHGRPCTYPRISSDAQISGTLVSGAATSKVTVISYLPDTSSTKSPFMITRSDLEMSSHNEQATSKSSDAVSVSHGGPGEGPPPAGPVFTTADVVVSVFPTAIVVGTQTFTAGANTAVTLPGGVLATAGPLGVAISSGPLVPFAAAPGFSPSGTVGDTRFSFVPGGINVEGTTLSLSKPTSLTLPGGTVVIGQNGGVMIDGTTVQPPVVIDGPLKGSVDSKSFEFTPASIVVSGTTLLTTKPTAITLPNGQRVVVGSGGVVQVAGLVVPPSALNSGGNMNGITFSADGPHLTIDGHSINLVSPTQTILDPSETVSIGDGGVLFNGTPVPIPNFSPIPTAGIAGGLYYSIDSKGNLIVHSQTINLSKPTATVLDDGSAVTVGLDGVLLNETPIPIPSSFVVAADMTAPLKPITTHGLTFAVGNHEVVISGSTFFVPPGATKISLTISNQTLVIGPDGVVFPETTIAIADVNSTTMPITSTLATLPPISGNVYQATAQPTATSKQSGAMKTVYLITTLKETLLLASCVHLFLYSIY